MRHMECVTPLSPVRSALRSKYFRSLGAACFLSFGLFTHGVHADSRFSKLPSISAEHLTFSSDGEEIIARSVVQLSPNGMKVFDFGDGHSAEIIQNFNDDRTWLINRIEQVVYEMPTSDGPWEHSQHALSHGTTSADVYESTSDGIKQLGLLSGVPCIGLNGQLAGSKVWRGQPVDVWNCKHMNKLISKQYFSHDWQIVVREHRIGSSIEELRSLQNVVFPTKHFNPKKNLRAADLRELLLGYPEISRFSE